MSTRFIKLAASAAAAASLLAPWPGARGRIEGQRLPQPTWVTAAWTAPPIAELGVTTGTRALLADGAGAAAPAAPLLGEHRNPIVAGFLGIIPGLGHMYAGESRRGLAVAAVWLGSGMVLFSGADRAIREPASVVFFGSVIFGIADGALAAQRFNEKHAQSAPGTVADTTRTSP